MTSDTVTTRFAPSPTGWLHLGHAFAALSAARAASPGHFLLRIEDLDEGRARAEFDAALREDLHWLGLAWREPVLRQSQRAAAYRQALERLEQQGLVYPCFCSRRDIAEQIAHAAHAPHRAQPVYPGTCRQLTPAQRHAQLSQASSYALRLDATRAAERLGTLRFNEVGRGPNAERGSIEVEPLRHGDIVLARRDLPAAYHLAVVVDDAFQGVTRVTRGEDLFSATHVQRVLQALLQLPVPEYAHHRLILDEHGRKFSKRDQAVTLRALRAAGEGPEQIRRRLSLSS